MFRLFDNPLHLIILLVVVLIIFGAGKLPGVGAALGQSIKEFKKATTTEGEASTPAAVSGNTCTKCGSANAAAAQFCASCGTALQPQVTTGSGGEVFCSTCGSKNPAESRFCVKCGKGLSVPAG